MKKHLIFFVLMLSAFSIHAEGVKLTCTPYQSSCTNCPEYQTLFPIEEFSQDPGSLDIEADQSEILNTTYHLTGDVNVKSESFVLAADDVRVNSADESTIATGNVRFQDQAYLITSDSLLAKKDDGKLTATATNANYQDYSAGLGGANGYSEIIEKKPTSVLLTNSTYSLCPVGKNDWLIDSDQIELNLEKNRGVADNATIKFYGVPILYTPKWSWVLSGRGSGFLTPNYSTYYEQGEDDNSYSIRVPYYFNLAPDRDLLVAMNYMSSRGFIYEGKYRQLISPIASPDSDDLFEVEAKYLPEDKITSLKRWLLKFNEEFDVSNKTHLSTQYYRVSDPEYFEEIARSNTNTTTLKSYLKLDYTDKGNGLSAKVLTEDEQVINAGTPGYTRALEGSISKDFYLGQKKVVDYIQIKDELNLDKDEQAQYEIENPFPILTKLGVALVSTKFAHHTPSKDSGTRTHGNLGISRALNIKYPIVTPNASVAITNYSLKNTPNVNRTVFGTGLDIDFTINNKTNLYGYDVNNRISPKITYNYRGKVVQGNIPIFDTTDKYDDILSFASLTSGERYTGLDRITNANDITLSLESNYRLVNTTDEDSELTDLSELPDLLSLKIAQSFYTDDEVVSDTANTNYETRKSYSDIAASIDFALNKFSFSSAAQFNPDTSRIVKKTNTISYEPSSRKFLSISFIDDGTEDTEKYYGAYPVTSKVHLFGGLEKSSTTGVRSNEASGLAYESCCWAFRIAHFKEKKSVGYNYSTGLELVLTGLGSTSSPLKGRIESNIPGYTANLRE